LSPPNEHDKAVPVGRPEAGLTTRAGRSDGSGTVTTPKLKIKAAAAQEVCALYEVSLEAQRHLAAKMPPLDFVAALTAARLLRDAVDFLAHALPKREAVWWSGLCAREVLPQNAPPKLMAAVQAAEAWVYRPTEENRRKAQQSAKAIAESHPAQWAAMGAFWSGGSMAPPNGPEVKPPEQATARAVAGAIVMAATGDPVQADERFARFLNYGIDIANGGTGRPAAKA
jgi:hypothetical protein